MKKVTKIEKADPFLTAAKELIKMYPKRTVFFEFLIDALYALNAIHSEFPDRWTKLEKMNRFHTPCFIASTLTANWTVDGIRGEDGLVKALYGLADESGHTIFQEAVSDLLIAISENLDGSVPTPDYFDDRLEGIKALSFISRAIYDSEVQAGKSRAAAA